MRCLLIDIGYDFEEYDEPLGVEVLYSLLKFKAPFIKTNLFCSNYDGLDYRLVLNETKPDLIGISTHINTWNRLKMFFQEYFDYCRNNNTNALVVLGGELATYEFEMLLKEYPDVICIIGEGEHALLSIATVKYKYKTIDSTKESLVEENIPNVALIFNGKLHISRREVIDDLSILNFAVEHVYIDKTLEKNGLVRIEASRGCPWNNCSFCVLKWKYAGKKWRPFTKEKILSEIVSISKKNIETIYFTDEEFIGTDLNHIKSVLKGIVKLKEEGVIRNNIELVASTSVNALSGKYTSKRDSIEEVFQLMKKAGFRSVFLGLESGSDSQLKRFCKGITVDEIERIIAKLKENGIETDIGYILFDPLMTIEELGESLDFLERNGLHNDLSRFAKRLRIVPHTRYCEFKEVNIKGFDNNAVEYTYSFKDEKISQIFLKYNEWENRWLSYTHKLQADIRFLTSSNERTELIKKLKTFRGMEYRVLRFLVNYAESGEKVSNIQISEIDKKLQVIE